MKKLYLALLFFGILPWCFAEPAAENTALSGEKQKMSFAFGMVIGSDMRQSGMTFDYDAFARGLEAVMENGETPFTMDEAIELVQGAFQAAVAEQARASQKQEAAYLEENGNRSGILTTESGLQYELITEGTGERPGPSDVVQVNYRGALRDGTVFDDSYERGEPAEFPLAGVISGWSEGIALMKVGGKSLLYIPSKLAYGPQGAGGVIPPYATLIFEVELLSIVPPAETPEGQAPETPEKAEGE
jgi:FKBP-type peptidyl-prolyl cis-trans isomerase